MRGYRALLVGAGGMGRHWGENLRDCERVELAGWVDIRPGAAAAAAEALGVRVAHTGDDLAAALAELRPDFVVDVTVPEAHHDVTLAALAAGCHVLGEKPLADTMERARAMVAAAERAGRHRRRAARLPARPRHRRAAHGRVPRQHQEPRDGLRGHRVG